MPCCPFLRLRSLLILMFAIVFISIVAMPASRRAICDAPVRAEEAADAGWPLFRGNPLMTGVATTELRKDLKVRWKFTAKDGIESTPVIVGGVVYVGAFDGYLYALDLAKGTEKWKYSIREGKSSLGIKAAAAVADGYVYVGDEEGYFHCVDAEKGKKKWVFKTGGEITSGANFSGDNVLFGSADSELYCLTKADGKLVWKFKIEGGPVNASPTIVGGKTFVAGCDSSLHVIDVATGKELSAVELGGQVGATAAVAGEELYVGLMTNQVLAVNWKQGKVLWTFEPERSKAFYASAALTPRLVVTASRDKKVYAIDRKKGTEVWSFATGRDVDSSPVVSGKHVYVGSTDGKLYVLDLEKGTEVAAYDLDDSIVGSPAVSKGALVIGTSKGELFCYE